MKTITVALVMLIGGPQQLPRELNVSQIAGTGGGSAVAIPAAPAAPTTQQLPAVQLETQPQAEIAPFSVEIGSDPIDLRLLLTAIAQYFNLNLLMDLGISETVRSMNLVEVTIEEALRVLLDPRGVEYRIEGDLLIVEPPQMESRTFEFNYITTQRTLSRSLSASASAGGGVSVGSTGPGGGAATGGSGGGSNTSVSGTEQTSLLEDVDAQLQLLKSDEGTVFFNQMAGLIFATDFPRNLDTIASFIEMVENAVSRQVVIEAKIIEVNLDDDFQAGIDWTAILGNTLTMTQSLGALGGGFNLNVTHDDFTAVIQALSQHGTVNVLSSPTVSTLNNQPAVMRVGTQDVFFTTTTQVDPRSGTIVQTATVPRTINEGVVLDVTPQISSDGIITMNIHPTITERTGQATSPDGLTVPIVDVREADTVVRVAEGETVVLAGLISNRTIEQVNKVPILGDIPLLGNLFKRVTRENEKTDMLILLTPTIMTVRTAADYARQRMEQQEQLKDGTKQ